jgi:DNA-binding Lrp family transcriptional regulator
LQKKIGLSPDAIVLRIKKLIKNSVLTRFRIVLDSEKAQVLHYKVLFYFNIVTEGEVNEFIDYCKTIPHVFNVIKSLGEWDLELDIETENIKQFREIMQELTYRFPSLIKEFESLLVFKIHKFTMLPEFPRK